MLIVPGQQWRDDDEEDERCRLRWEVLAGAAVVLVAVSTSAEQLSVRYYVTRNEEAVVRCGGGVLLVPRLPAT